MIVNPASQNGATGRYWPEIRAALDMFDTNSTAVLFEDMNEVLLTIDFSSMEEAVELMNAGV